MKKLKQVKTPTPHLNADQMQANIIQQMVLNKMKTMLKQEINVQQSRHEQLWTQGNQSVMHKQQIKKVGQLIQTSNELLGQNSRKSNINVSKHMLGEKIKSDYMWQIANELHNLKEIPIEYLRVYFDQIKIDMESASENELLSKSYYENSRHDPILCRIIEERRKARN